MRRHALAAVLIGASCLAAQERYAIPTGAAAPAADWLQAEVRRVIGGARPGGIGFIRVDVTNPASVERDLQLELSCGYGAGFFVRDRAVIEPGGFARLFLPLHALSVGGRLRARVAGSVTDLGGWIESTGPGMGHAAILFVSDVTRSELGWRDALVRRAGLASDEIDLTALAPDDLPPRWPLLTGFDFTVIDGRSPGLDRTRQAMLVERLRAGEATLVIHADRLPEGALREAVLEELAVIRDHGFGRLLALSESDSASLPAGRLRGAVDAAMARWLDATLLRPSGQAGARPFDLSPSGPLPSALWIAAPIPGLGRAPVRVFFLLLLGFAILVGPVNYLYWWRRRRLAMLVLTVPALGFGATAVLLVYGFAAEGFGIRQVERSVTVLDQIRHESATWASRTLYAGLAPDAIRPSSGTRLFSPGMFDAAQSDLGPRFELGPDGVIGGGLVPSRTLCVLPTATVAPERARLRFRKRGDGRLDVLTSDGLAPVAAAGAVALCDAEGACWLAGEDGTLARVDRGSADAEIASMVRRVTHVEPVTGALAVERVVVPNGLQPEQQLRVRLTEIAALRPLTYVARVVSSPGMDDLGLEADERSGEHLVVGRLSAEDIVD